jgi:hypothetical protein
VSAGNSSVGAAAEAVGCGGAGVGVLISDAQAVRRKAIKRKTARNFFTHSP